MYHHIAAISEPVWTVNRLSNGHQAQPDVFQRDVSSLIVHQPSLVFDSGVVCCMCMDVCNTLLCCGVDCVMKWTCNEHKIVYQVQPDVFHSLCVVALCPTTFAHFLLRLLVLHVY
jgi:hypothetical protein